jgi:hypothetical protein
MRAALSAPPETTLVPLYLYALVADYKAYRKGVRQLTTDQATLSTGPSCLYMAFPWLLPCASTSYIRVSLFHDDTARRSAAVDHDMSEMLSLGGSFTSTSFLRSPWVGFALLPLPRNAIIACSATGRSSLSERFGTCQRRKTIVREAIL